MTFGHSEVKMVKKCIKCGIGSDDEASFCSKCGTRFPMIGRTAEIKLIPIGVTTPIRLGMCSYHKNINATHVCRICGKPICVSCSKTYIDLMVCPECYRQIFPALPTPFMISNYPR